MAWTREAIDALFRRDEAAWSLLLDELERIQRSVRHRWNLTPAEADRVRGDVLLLLLRHRCRMIRRCRAAESFPHLLQRVADRRAYQFGPKGSARRPVLVPEIEDAPAEAERPASFPGREALLRFLRDSAPHLTPLQTETLWRRDLLGWTWSDVARSLDRSRDAVQQAHRRAVKTLRILRRPGGGS